MVRLLAAPALALLLGACSSGGGSAGPGTTTTRVAASSTTTTAAAGAAGAELTPMAADTPGTFAVGSLDDTLVDKTRETAAHREELALPDRTLPLLVLYPAEGSPGDGAPTADAPPSKGPWPLIVFGHGLGGAGPNYVATMQVWASAGYVVVAPTFPLSNTNTPGGTVSTDVPEQAKDETFVINWAIEQSQGDSGPLAGLIDTERIGVAGHSLGGFTALAAGYNACCQENRIDAIAEWAGGFGVRASGDAAAEADKVLDGPPLLIVHGDADGTVSYVRGVDVWNRTSAPKYFVTLVNGPHIPPYVQGLNDPAAAVVTSSTLDFFDRYLKVDGKAIDRLTEMVKKAGPELATVMVDEG